MYPTSEHPSVLGCFFSLPPHFAQHVIFLFCVRWMIGNKLQDIYSGSTFPCFHILKVFLFLLFVSGCTGLARKNVVGCHRRAPWKRFAAAFRQRRKKVRNGGGWGGAATEFSSIFFSCVCVPSGCREKPQIVTLFHRKVKAQFPNIQLKHFGRQLNKILRD